jgi:two-component system chemotaxis sensor kinase CheA
MSTTELTSEDIEIIQDFIQESQDMIEQLEPAIIELGNGCKGGNCWEIVGCTHTDCSRYGQSLDFPCWLELGHIGDGARSCPLSSSEQDCLTCKAFSMTNGDQETMNAIFRLFHSMKGSAGFLDLMQISRAAHAAENLLDLIRSGRIKMEPVHVDLLCRSCDFAKEALEHVSKNYNDQEMTSRAAEVTEALKKAIDEASSKCLEFCKNHQEIEAAAATETQEDGTAGSGSPEFEMQITPEMLAAFIQEADELVGNVEQGLLQWEGKTDDQEIIANLFRNIHSFKGNCGFFQFPDLERLSHLMETILDTAKSGGELTGVNPAESLLKMVDVFKEGLADIAHGGSGRVEKLDKYVDDLRALLTRIGVTPESYNEEPRLGEMLVGKGLVDKETVSAALDAQKKPVGEILVEMGSITQDQVKEVVVEQQEVQQQKAEAAKTAPKKELQRQDIRVDLTKMDSLINLIGELVIAENMVINNPDLRGLGLENFQKASQHMSKIIRDLQEMAMVLRMIPVSGLFRRMIRLVHDLSSKAGKKVDLQLLGEETEVDKTVIETITDPLVHLLRNSLDHGLETPAVREKAGKPEKGIVKLSAQHEEGEVWITVEDDGRGLNRDKLLAKAISKGLIQDDGSDMSDKAVYNLIFAPGFSTAEKITDISGRGVGMDVVRKNLEKINGKIDVDSRDGLGTRVRLRIPLTLAIIEGMLILVGRTRCILPLLAIREIFCPEPEAITVTPDGLELVKVRGEFYPIIRMDPIINNESGVEKLNEGVLVLVEHQETKVCLFVNEILGQQQTVIKGLSEYLGSARCVSGCTILGDGEVCLILDVGTLVEINRNEKVKVH